MIDRFSFFYFFYIYVEVLHLVRLHVWILSFFLNVLNFFSCDSGAFRYDEYFLVDHYSMPPVLEGPKYYDSKCILLD